MTCVLISLPDLEASVPVLIARFFLLSKLLFYQISLQPNVSELSLHVVDLSPTYSLLDRALIECLVVLVSFSWGWSLPLTLTLSIVQSFHE